MIRGVVGAATLLVLGAALLIAPEAWAGSGTIKVRDGQATPVIQTYDVITDSSGNFVGMVGICDGAAAAQCAAVTAGNALKVDGSAVTQPVSGSVSVSNFPATQPVSGSVSISNFPATQPVSGTVTANQGTAGATPWPVTVVPSTSQGWGPFLANGLSTTVKTVKASAGELGAYHCLNPNASAVYIQIFDAASGSITLGTTVPKLSLGLPAAAAGNVEWANGINFATAINVAATTTAAGSTAPGTAVDCNFGFK